MVRVSLNGERVSFSSKLEIAPELWDKRLGRVGGRSLKATNLNNHLEDINACLRDIYYRLEKTEPFVSSEMIRASFLGIDKKSQSILTLFDKHNEDFQKLIGKEKTMATFQKYLRTRKRMSEYIKENYNMSDMPLGSINYEFVVGFELYLKTKYNCSNNTTAKIMQILKRIINIAKNNGWIVADPFANYSIRLQKVDRGYLTEDEILLISGKKFSSRRLEQVRDVFIFSCYTGLAYIDVRNLRSEHIQKSFDDKLWIITKRQKTDTTVKVPLLEVPRLLINKYKGKLDKGQLLPVLTNQKTNSYLKEIADVCGINKNLTFHLARHTFATTTTLAKGVPIETVSKMLGHTKIATTQIYARITDSKISNDMQRLAGVLEESSNQHIKSLEL